MTDARKSAPYKRNPGERVFVNRSLRLEKIRHFGFDMDYTLVQYKSPEMEYLSFDMVVDRLIQIGYPAEIRKFKFDPIFSVRGLWFDYTYGNLLKVDGFGNILEGMHGIKFLKTSEIEEQYPNKYLPLTESRVFVLNTLFNLPETPLISQLIDFFDKHPDYTSLPDKTGVSGGDVIMTYKSIFQDCRRCVDWVHEHGKLKRTIMANPEKYVLSDDRAERFLRQLRENGKNTFLLTNSEWYFTDVMMTHVLGAGWRSLFNMIVVDACKPRWFGEGTVFREVDTVTGAYKLGVHAGPLREGVVYSGGSCDSFQKMFKARGKDVLYIGDHIFGDVLRSKKSRGWRTFLVVPELEHELTVWTDRKPLFEQLGAMENMLAEIYKNLDGGARHKPAVKDIVENIRKLSHEMDQEYGVYGSLFRAGGRMTFFASQVERYADVYASSCYNLVNYPSFYFFRAPMQLMPHESTVDHAATLRSRSNTLTKQESVGQQVRGWTRMTANENEFCHEEEDEEQSNSDGEPNKRDRNKSASDESAPDAEQQEQGTEPHPDVVAVAPAFVEKNINSP
ncbi:unnamed protein product [Caenorhabditis auriculariae]|uniref:Uncharacterized protein n=1 Tax=Caenorhabditis auriculariae TaxID=2777116 RepID=A0A8S1HA90_9PELO|nr:unnamed protein product [Caenorhabditis auriculariae]